MPKHTADALTAKGYTVEMGVIAVRPEVSLCSTLLRFCRMNEGGTIPRATAVPAHDETVAALPGNLDALVHLDCISRLRIWDRELTLLFDSAVDTGNPSAALLGCWSHPWSAEELRHVWEQVRYLREQEDCHSLGQGAVVEELAQRLRRIDGSGQQA